MSFDNKCIWILIVFRFMLNRENVANSLIMIQPTLEAYALDQPPQPGTHSNQSSTSPFIIVIMLQCGFY